ncbi:aminopeptidase N-like [Nylanderia fulva]|uniref:aminopeptidase N-like n=1 Tax=Nylanderia fulva TaxID=613905 RepID=UPI0010FB1DE8|nr:aminopeptidase N-like [Nylanderia fulva]
MWPLTSQNDSLLEIRQSIRAPFILRMMQIVFTKKIFWNGIRSYVNSTQLYHRSFENFMKAVVPESRKSEMVLRTMEYWASEEHCPLVKIIRYYDNPTAKIVISVPNFDILKTYCLPITFTTQTYRNFNNFSYISLITRNFVLTLPFKEDGWIIFNIQQTGYYRVNYDEENWQRITNYLHSRNYKKIHVLNRAQIIDDAFNLMIAGHLHSYIFWNIISYLHQEEDYIAWYPLFKALEYICSTFPVLKEKIGYFTVNINKE